MEVLPGSILLLLMLYAFLYWRQGFFLVLFFAVFEGAIRKWLIPEFQQWVYFAKDALTIGAVLGYYGPRLSKTRKLFQEHPANSVLAFFVAVCALELFNPRLPNLWVGLFGIRGYIIYIPLMFMVPAVFPTDAFLRRFTRIVLLVSLIPLLIGPVQFWSPSTSVINRYAHDTADIITFASTDHPRITSTFPFITGFTTFLMILLLLVVALLLVEKPGWFRRFLYGVLALSLANIYMTGSRAPIAFLAVTLPVVIFMFIRTQTKTDVKLAFLLIAAIPAITIVTAKAFPEAVDAFVNRAVESQDDVDVRIIDLWRMPLEAARESDVMGWGVGSTHPAKYFLIPIGSQFEEPPLLEGEMERVILETGPFGFLLGMTARLLVCLALWRAFKRSAGYLRPWCAAGFCFGLICLVNHTIFNTTAGVFFWFVAGFGLMAVKRRQAVTATGAPSPRFIPLPQTVPATATPRLASQ